VLTLGIVVPVAVIWAQRTPAEKPAPPLSSSNPNAAAPPAAPVMPPKPRDDLAEVIDEVQGRQDQAVNILGDVHQGITWVVSLIPVIACIAGFIILIVICRMYSRRLNEEMAQLSITLDRPLEHRDKLD
jgi:hypothetical protein